MATITSASFTTMITAQRELNSVPEAEPSRSQALSAPVTNTITSAQVAVVDNDLR